MQHIAPQVKVNLTLLQYNTAMISAETAIQALQTHCKANAVDYKWTAIHE